MITLDLKLKCPHCKKPLDRRLEVDLSRPLPEEVAECPCGKQAAIPSSIIGKSVEKEWGRLKRLAEAEAGKKDASADDIIDGVLGSTPEQMARRLLKIQEGLDAVAAGVKPLTDSAALLREYNSRLGQLQTLLNQALAAQEERSLYQHLDRQLADLSSSLKAQAAEHAASLKAQAAEHAASLKEAVGGINDRQPVEVDAVAVGDRILDALADSEKSRALFGRVTESYFRPRLVELERLLNGIPKLLDALDRPLEKYGAAGNGSGEPEGEGGEVLRVLREVEKKVNYWKLARDIERFPEEFDDYNPRLHESEGVEPTADESLHKRVAWATLYGYRWGSGGEVIRKAQVVVYGPPVDGFATNAPAPDGAADGRGETETP